MKSLETSKQSSYVGFIAEFIELKRTDKSDLRFSALIVRYLMSISQLSLKTLYEILLLLPPLENDSEVNFLSEFMILKCGSTTEHDSFVSIVEGMESHLGCDIASTPRYLIPQILVASHPKVLPMLFDRGLPMISDAELAILRNFKANISRSVKSEVALLDRFRCSSNVAHFPKSLICDAFTDLESSSGLPLLFGSSLHIARIFDFLIGDCGCVLH